MKKVCVAPDCTNTFEPSNPRQIYCSDRCRERTKRRKYVKQWISQERCIQCGGEMDYPKSFHSNKVSPKYCSKCQEYFRKYYRERRQQKKQQSPIEVG